MEIIDPAKHMVRGKTREGKNFEVAYDKLLIASGASPIKPEIKGIDKEGVLFFNRLEDARRLSERVSKVKEVIVIGAGVIGIEVAVALNRMGCDVEVVELLGQILPQILDEGLASLVERKLSSSGIKFLLGEGVSEIIGVATGTWLQITSSQSLCYQTI